MVRRIKRSLLAVTLAMVCFTAGLGTVTPKQIRAEEIKTLAFDSENVLDDLLSSAGFDITDYPFRETAEPTVKVINVVEYCYSFRENFSDNYGLYLYLYNPGGLNIKENSYANKAQIAVGYDADGKPNDYEKFELVFCSKATEPDYYGLFYKFRVSDHVSADGKTIAERVNGNERRYDISGIELMTAGAANATEYAVNGSYRFTGYAAGYGPDAWAESTLDCKVEYLETIALSVKHTFYRTATSSKGAGWQNQLDTVYFAVPERFFDAYGKLQRIKAEWYEYKTKDIVVTSNNDFYNAALPYIGKPTGNVTLQFGMPDYNSSIGYSLGQDAGDAGGGMDMAKWGWNLGTGYLHTPALALYYLFKTDSIGGYDPYADIVESGGISSNALYEYIRSYDKTYDGGTLPVKDGAVSADLFTEDIDENRKMDTEFGKIQKGYSYYDFDADVDLQHLDSWQESNPSLWDNWVNWGLWNAMFGNIPQEESKTISPIYLLRDGDLNGSAAEVSERLLVNSSDVDDIRTYADNARKNNEVVVLFRFATGDYYSAGVDIIQIDKGFLGSDKHTSGQAYRAFESVFLDFDIIQLTFDKDGVYTVIPVVSCPIDIVNGITPPVRLPENDWWNTVLLVLVVILLCLLLVPVLPYLLRFVVWVIGLPFKTIGAAMRSVKRRKERKGKEKQNKAE